MQEQYEFTLDQRSRQFKKPYAIATMAFFNLANTQLVTGAGSDTPDLLAQVLWLPRSVNEALANLEAAVKRSENPYAFNYDNQHRWKYFFDIFFPQGTFHEKDTRSKKPEDEPYERAFGRYYASAIIAGKFGQYVFSLSHRGRNHFLISPPLASNRAIAPFILFSGHVSSELLDDPEMVLAGLKQVTKYNKGFNYVYRDQLGLLPSVSPRLRADLSFMTQCVTLNGQLILAASDHLKFHNKELVLRAILHTQNSIFDGEGIHNFLYAQQSARAMADHWCLDDEVMTYAIMHGQNTPTITTLSHRLRSDPNILLAIPRECRSDAFHLCPDQTLKKSPAFILAMDIDVPVSFYLKMGATLIGSIALITVGILAIASIIAPAAAAIGMGVGVASVLVGSSGVGFFAYKVHRVKSSAAEMKDTAYTTQLDTKIAAKQWLLANDTQAAEEEVVTRGYVA